MAVAETDFPGGGQIPGANARPRAGDKDAIAVWRVGEGRAGDSGNDCLFALAAFPIDDRQAFAVARALGMKIMIGCMIESSLGITAAAHLAPLCDFADLDGNLLVDNDPYRGVRVASGRLLLPQGGPPGLGIAAADRAM